MTRFKSAIIVILAATASLLPCSRADAVTKAMWGPLDLPDGRSAFPTYQDLGVDVLQMQLLWRDVAPTQPQSPRDPADPAYRWPSTFQRAIDEGRGAGVRIALMVRASPPWANGGRKSKWAPNTKDFADFLVAASRRYPSVRYWMMWGEPTRNFRPMPTNSPTGPRAYAKVADAGYAALKGVSRDNIVIGGMTFTVGSIPPSDFVRWMRLPSGRPPRLDLFGHNPFSVRFPDLRKRPYDPSVRDFSDLDTFHAEISRVYRSARMRVPAFWLSEYNVSSDRANRAFYFFVSRSEQARWLTRAYSIARRTKWIRGLGWYTLVDESPAVPGSLTVGLLGSDGTPKPSYGAYRAVP